MFHGFLEKIDKYTLDQESMKTPKRQSESINLRRTDNTMAKRKSTKGQTTIYKTHT
jgi:hypothetical protein